MFTLYNGVQFPQEGPNLANVERIDMGAVPMTLAMMQRGMQVDLDHFAKMDRELTDDMDRITEEVRSSTGVYINLSSGDQISQLLFKTLGLKQARPKFTRSGDRESVEEEVLIAIQHDHECVPKILDYKELDKLRGTYVRPMPKLARRVSTGEWRIYPNLGMTRVPSGRYNCKEPNLLAMPNRTKRGREIRKGFITKQGWTYVSIDFSQFEPRACAHYSQDEGLIYIYETGQDIYSDFAIAAFHLDDGRYEDDAGWHYPNVDKREHRFPAKTCILAAIYDVSAGGLLEQMPVICGNCRKEATEHDCGSFESFWTEDKCQELLNALYLKYPGILTDRKRHHGRARMRGYIWDLWGRLHHVAAVRSVHQWVVNAALREVGNFPYQGLNAGALKLSMAATMDDLEADPHLSELIAPLLPIHDELLFEVREDMAEDWAQHTAWRFETSVPLTVPVKASYAMAATWGDLDK